MTFTELRNALAAFNGIDAESTIRSSSDANIVFAQLVGVLVLHNEPIALPEELTDAVGEAALTIQIGADPANHVSVWPDRYIRASKYSRGTQIEIVTRDASMTVRRRSRAWID